MTSPHMRFVTFIHLAIMLIVLLLAMKTHQSTPTEIKTKVVQYKRDIHLYCGDEPVDDDHNDDNDDDSIKDHIDDDDDNDGIKDDMDDDDDGDNIKDDDETLLNLWKGVQFFRAPPITPNDTKASGGGSPYELVKYDGLLYKFNTKRNTLHIHYPKRREIESSYSCNSSDPPKTIFFQFKLAPFLFVPDYESFSHFEGEEQIIECKALFGFEGGEKLTWKWRFGDKVLESSENATITVNSTEHTSSLHLKSLSNEKEGTYRCIVSNQHGVHSRSVILRIKNRYGFVWPLLGALGVLVAVVVIVAISECIQKAKEKKQRSE